MPNFAGGSSEISEAKRSAGPLQEPKGGATNLAGTNEGKGRLTGGLGRGETENATKGMQALRALGERLRARGAA